MMLVVLVVLLGLMLVATYASGAAFADVVAAPAVLVCL